MGKIAKSILIFFLTGGIVFAYAKDENETKNIDTKIDKSRNMDSNDSNDVKIDDYTQSRIKIEASANEIKIDKLITLAKSKLGSSYLFAKAGPDNFDCSGFVYYLFQEHNISIPRTSLAQSQNENNILNREQIKKGDILFFDTSNRGHINHSGVYLGKDKFIHASSGKANGVTISSLNEWYKDKFRWAIRKIKKSHN